MMRLGARLFAPFFSTAPLYFMYMLKTCYNLNKVVSALKLRKGTED